EQNQIPDSEWMSKVDTSKERYKIQSGDTLWDISKTFFGDGQLWPKVWSMNSNITNPHEINPGNQIVFTPGSESQAPSLSIQKGQDQESDQMELATNPNDVEIPEPEEKLRPVLQT